VLHKVKVTHEEDWQSINLVRFVSVLENLAYFLLSGLLAQAESLLHTLACGQVTPPGVEHAEVAEDLLHTEGVAVDIDDLQRLLIEARLLPIQRQHYEVEATNSGLDVVDHVGGDLLVTAEAIAEAWRVNDANLLLVGEATPLSHCVFALIGLRVNACAGGEGGRFGWILQDVDKRVAH